MWQGFLKIPGKFPKHPVTMLRFPWKESPFPALDKLPGNHGTLSSDMGE